MQRYISFSLHFLFIFFMSGCGLAKDMFIENTPQSEVNYTFTDANKTKVFLINTVAHQYTFSIDDTTTVILEQFQYVDFTVPCGKHFLSAKTTGTLDPLLYEKTHTEQDFTFDCGNTLFLTLDTQLDGKFWLNFLVAPVMVTDINNKAITFKILEEDEAKAMIEEIKNTSGFGYRLYPEKGKLYTN